MRKLEEITISNFKSIRQQTLELNELNVFIGGNGAGKSNFINVFKFLQEVIHRNLQGYVLKSGGANALLHFGSAISQVLTLSLTFGDISTSNGYEIMLSHTLNDTLGIDSEFTTDHNKIKRDRTIVHKMGNHNRESAIVEDTHSSSIQILNDLKDCRVYHFHDTSETAQLKALGDVDDNRFLRPQAENLAAFLYWLQEKRKQEFSFISSVIQQVAPFFGGFLLAPSKLNESRIRLEWLEKGSDAYFNASSLSDGTLRFICLATLLLQPELPSLILLDEPELGLHPAAITLLAELISSASTRTQVIVATQSVTLINQFAPKDIWTVDREDSQSVFRQLDEDSLKEWLESYSIGELWEKNILGARP